MTKEVLDKLQLRLRFLQPTKDSQNIETLILEKVEPMVQHSHELIILTNRLVIYKFFSQ